jgi:hypothetical protein
MSQSAQFTEGLKQQYRDLAHLHVALVKDYTKLFGQLLTGKVSLPRFLVLCVWAFVSVGAVYGGVLFSHLLYVEYCLVRAYRATVRAIRK